MKAVILGATGLVGSELLKQLLADSHFKEITTIGRTNPAIEHPKLTKIQKEYEEWKQSDFDGDVLFCCLGSTIKKAGSQANFRQVDYEMPLKASILFHGHFILVSAIGADYKSKVFYNRIKGEVERDIRKVGRQLSVVRPSLLLGNRSESRPSEFFAQKVTPLLNPFMPKKYRAIKARDVAQTMIELSLGRKPSNKNIETA